MNNVETELESIKMRLGNVEDKVNKIDEIETKVKTIEEKVSKIDAIEEKVSKFDALEFNLKTLMSHFNLEYKNDIGKSPQ